jgi:thiol-disulfide isomerase/thioredoxin
MERVGGRVVQAVRVTTALAVALLGLAGSVIPGEKFTKAPPITLPDLDGSKVQVQYGDAPVTIVNFWATWCLPCREEMPQINRIFLKYRDRGVRAVGIALQSGEPAEVKSFLAERKLAVAYPVLMGDDDFATTYGDIEILPTTYLIASDGKVVRSFYGVLPEFESTLGGQIEKELARTPSKTPAKVPSKP